DPGGDEGGFLLPRRRGRIDDPALLVRVQAQEFVLDRLSVADQPADAQHGSACQRLPVLPGAGISLRIRPAAGKPGQPGQIPRMDGRSGKAGSSGHEQCSRATHGLLRRMVRGPGPSLCTPGILEPPNPGHGPLAPAAPTPARAAAVGYARRMNRLPPLILALAGLAVALSPAPVRAQAYADMILADGKVWTGNPAQPEAEAIAILDGRVAA